MNAQCLLNFKIMWTFTLFILLSSILGEIARAQSLPEKRLNYEKFIKFYVFREDFSYFVSTFDQPLESQGCSRDKNFSFLLVGWNATFTTWADKTTQHILRISGGCVCYVDYSAFSAHNDSIESSLELAKVDFYPIARIVSRKVVQVGNFHRMFVFGDSFGAVLAIEVGATAANGQIARMHLCDPVQQPIYPHIRMRDPKSAGKSVSCLRTDFIIGGTNYNCHQDWRAGLCGWWQPASPSLISKKSHELCSALYNSAFTHNFVPRKPSLTTLMVCRPKRMANMNSSACRGALMGYRDASDPIRCRGEFFVRTTKYPPYV